MATAEQIKALIRSYDSEDNERFYSIALQVAAHEAKLGHISLAHEIRSMLNQKRQNTGSNVKQFPINQDLHNLIVTESPETTRSSLILPKSLSLRVDRIIHEFRQQNKLKAYGLKHRKKFLLVGTPGTGKTMTAGVLAHELHLPLHTIQVDRLVTKFMGETSAKLRQIFDFMRQSLAVYLFDEFDAIGGERSKENDVGEMRRVLNSFLQFIEQDKSDSLIVATTNNGKLLDQALFRRFDDILHFSTPDAIERRHLIENTLGTFKSPKLQWKNLVEASDGLNHAEIKHACLDTIKNAILDDTNKVTYTELVQIFKDRKEVYHEYRR